MYKKKVAIIGANGFLGLSLSRAFKEKGFDVVGFIRNSDTTKNKIYEKLNLNTKIVGNLEEIKRFNTNNIKYDYIINLAARAHVKDSLIKEGSNSTKKLNNIERNIVNNFNTSNTKIIHLSSAKVKLDKNSPYINDNELVYINTKLKSESIIKKNFKKFVILRPPLIYGPNVKANFLSLIKAVDYRLPLPFLNLENSRSYLFLGNLADAIFKIIETNKFCNKHYFISDGYSVSTKNLTDQIAKNLSKKPIYFKFNKNLMYYLAKIINKQSLLNKIIGDFVIDNRNIYRDIKWRPKYNLNFGIEKTCFWYKRMFKIKL